MIIHLLMAVLIESNSALEAIGESYETCRAKLMIDRHEGLTKTYNRFHADSEAALDIKHLRALHGELNAAVLRAYGEGESDLDKSRVWNDLADRAMLEFIKQDVDEGKTARTRFDWPAEFKDEVLARLLALNAERAAVERSAGLAPVVADDDAEIDEVDA